MSEILDIAAALSRLLKAENVLLICHKNPDGDTIGSAAALYWALKGLGKTVAVLCADPIPSRYDYMDIGLYTGQFTPRANPAAVWPLSAWRWKAWNTALAAGAPRSTLQKSRSPRPAPMAPIWRVSPACPA